MSKNQVQPKEVMIKKGDGYFTHLKAILINISPTYIPILGSLFLVSRCSVSQTGFIEKTDNRKIQSLSLAIKRLSLGHSLVYNTCE